MSSSISKLAGNIQSRWHRTERWLQWTIIFIAVLLVVIRLSLPWAIKSYVNHQMEYIPDYDGHVEKIHVHLWRGAYEIDNLSIRKIQGAVPVPLFSASVIDLSIQWKELFHGSIVGKVKMINPQVNFVASTNAPDTQTDTAKPWVSTLSSLFPFHINRIELDNGAVHFQSFHAQDHFDVYVTNLFTVATNLTNARQVNDKLPAGLHATGETLGHGLLGMDLKVNPVQPAPTFELGLSVTNVDMVQINDFLRSYGKLDVAHGTFNIFVSIASVDGVYKGYARVLFEHLDVFQWEKDRKKNVLDLFWQAIAGALSQGFKNQSHDQLATQIPVSGTFTNGHVHVIPAVGSLLRNAFVQALLPKIEPPVQLQDVQNDPPAEVKPYGGTNSPLSDGNDKKGGEKLFQK